MYEINKILLIYVLFILSFNSCRCKYISVNQTSDTINVCINMFKLTKQVIQ